MAARRRPEFKKGSEHGHSRFPVRHASRIGRGRRCLPISLKALREQVIEQSLLSEVERDEMLRSGRQRVINSYLRLT